MIESLNRMDPMINALERNAELMEIAIGEPHPTKPPISRAELEQKAISASYRYLSDENTVGINKAENSFRVVKVETDELGMAHVRMEQVIKGLRVYGQQVITHVDNDGAVQNLTGNYRRDLLTTRVNTKPIIKTEGAIARVSRNYHAEINSPSTELLIYPTTRGARLAYKVEFFDENGPARMVYFVDARSGRILNKQNLLATNYNPGVVPSMASPNPAFFKPIDKQLRHEAETTNFVLRARQRSMNY
jgi:Zn-dependent metalloprotease